LAAHAPTRFQSLPTQLEKFCWPIAGLAVERCGNADGGAANAALFDDGYEHFQLDEFLAGSSIGV